MTHAVTYVSDSQDYELQLKSSRPCFARVKSETVTFNY